MCKWFWYVLLEYTHGEIRRKYGCCGLAAGWIDVGVQMCEGIRRAYAQLGTISAEERGSARITTGHRLMSQVPDDRRAELMRRCTPQAAIFDELNHMQS